MKRLVACPSILFAFAGSLAAYEFADFNEAQQQMLQNGQSLVWTYEDAETHRQFTCVAAIVDAPLADAWALLDDKESAPTFFTNILKAKILKKEGDSVFVYQETRPVGIAKSFKYVIRHHPTPYKRFDFERVSGDLRHIEGTWFFDSVDEGRKTLLVYLLHIDMGALFPQALVVRTQKQRLPVVMNEIRKRLAELEQESAVSNSRQVPSLVNAGRRN